MIMRKLSTDKLVCYKVKWITLACRDDHDCERCQFADSVRKDRIERNKHEGELFDHNDVRLMTPKGNGRDWYLMPIIAKPDTLRRAGIDVNMYNQIFITTSGAGMFYANAGSELDGYFLSDRSKIFSFGRQDFYGIPNDKAVSRYEDLFFIDLKRYMKGR